MKNGYKYHRDIILTDRKQPSDNPDHRILNVILYFLFLSINFHKINSAHNNLWIYPKFSNFIPTLPLQLTNFIIFRDIRKPLKFPVFCLCTGAAGT